MNILVFTLAVDETHVTLGFAVRILRALAARFESIDVVTMYEGTYDLPPNVRVRSVGRERGTSKPQRFFAFYKHVFAVVRERKIDVAFAHMSHLFAWLFWPVAKLKKIPTMMWYAHGAIGTSLRLAHRAVDRVITSTPEGFRIPSTKVKYIGQAIDTGVFTPVDRQDCLSSTIRVVTVGRVASAKQLDLMIEALQRWGRSDWRLTIAGDATAPVEQEYADRVQKTHADERVTWLGRIDPEAIASVLHQSDVFINLSTTGSLDKAIVEAMATGCAVLSSNDGFVALAKAEGVDECIVQSNVESITAGLDRMTSIDRNALGRRLSAIAERHSFNGFIDRLTAELEDLATR